jgi:hypothetical protein
MRQLLVLLTKERQVIETYQIRKDNELTYTIRIRPILVILR